MQKDPCGDVPQSPAGSVPRTACTPAPKVLGRGMQQHSSSGTQKSKNPKKDQPKTMRFLD